MKPMLSELERIKKRVERDRKLIITYFELVDGNQTVERLLEKLKEEG